MVEVSDRGGAVVVLHRSSKCDVVAAVPPPAAPTTTRQGPERQVDRLPHGDLEGEWVLPVCAAGGRCGGVSPRVILGYSARFRFET